MVWTTPYTWKVNELVTADRLNTELRDNLLALKNPPSSHYTLNEASNYTTTSTSFVNVDATNLVLTLTTAGGDVLVHFHAAINGASGTVVYLDLDVDTTGRVGGDDGLVGFQVPYNGPGEAVSFTRLISGLSAGTHTFRLQWKVSSGTGLIYAGAGTAGNDLHPQFWVREVS